MSLSTTLRYPRITVVTPNYDQVDFIEKTICSVLEQDYPNLEYIIIDGGSTDGSVDIIKKYDEQLSYWVSEKDNGMYHAINKGFSRSTGDIMCWINSDDVLWENSLVYIAQLFANNTDVQWLQGYPTVIDENGEILYQRDPVASKYHFYLGDYNKDFSFIQQESTFWTRAIWEKAGGLLNTDYSMAADFDLWMRFFQFEQLYCTKRQLAAFRKREGQKSSDSKAYLAEARESLDTYYKKLSFYKKMVIRYSNKFGNKNDKYPINWIDI